MNEKKFSGRFSLQYLNAFSGIIISSFLVLSLAKDGNVDKNFLLFKPASSNKFPFYTLTIFCYWHSADDSKDTA